MIAALRGEATDWSSRRAASRVVMARPTTVIGMPAAAVRVTALEGRRLAVGVRRPGLCVLVRPVATASAPVHEEHGEWADEKEEEKDQSCCVHRAPTFRFGSRSASGLRVKGA